MRFEIAKVIQDIDLGEYHEAYAGKFVKVWVNPPREVKRTREETLQKLAQTRGNLLKRIESNEQSGVDMLEVVKQAFEKIDNTTLDWFALIWNQSSDPDCEWPVEDIRALYDGDPAFYVWLTHRTVQMIEDFRVESKKK